MTAERIMFLIFALAACGGAIAVVFTQNVVRMAFWLIVSLGSVAGLFFLLHADFIGAAQLLIYVGGTVVLLVFGVMLTASGPYLKIRSSAAETFTAGGVGLLMLSLLVWTVCSASFQVNEQAAGATARPLGFALLGLRPDTDDLERGLAADSEAAMLSESGEATDDELDSARTVELSTGYLLPFEIVSVHLLVVLIGAAYLARGKRRAESGEAV